MKYSCLKEFHTSFGSQNTIGKLHILYASEAAMLFYIYSIGKHIFELLLKFTPFAETQKRIPIGWGTKFGTIFVEVYKFRTLHTSHKRRFGKSIEPAHIHEEIQDNELTPEPEAVSEPEPEPIPEPKPEPEPEPELEPIPEPEPEPEPVAVPEEPVVDQKARPAVIDSMIDRQAWRTDMPGTQVKDIRSAISLNDRILFINMLFNQDPMAFQEALTKINQMTTLDEAVSYIVAERPDWDLGSETVYRFMMAVRRKIR